MSEPAMNTADRSQRLTLDLSPLDTLFFRDGRPFDAGSHAASRLPFPQTVAGAVRTWLAEAHEVSLQGLAKSVRACASVEEAFAAFGPEAAGIGTLQLRGPWFSRDDEILVPVPASLRICKEDNGICKEDNGKLVRLDPLEACLPGWSGAAPGMLPLWRRGRSGVEAAAGYLAPAGLRRFLEGGVPNREDVIGSDDLYGFDDRTGISVDPETNTARDGMIYGVRMLALKPGISLRIEVEGLRETLSPLTRGSHLMTLGGEGRRVTMRPVETAVNRPCVPPSPDRGRLVCLTTPACLAGWCPPALKPLAAAVPGYEAVSGWDAARRGPKPTRFVVPAGSTYFLPPGAVTRPDSFAGSLPESRLGWGCFVEGNWNHV